jgi:hypothetical protein
MIKYKATRAFTANGNKYEAGDFVPASSFYNLHALLSCKMVVEAEDKTIEVPAIFPIYKKHRGRPKKQ